MVLPAPEVYDRVLAYAFPAPSSSLRKWGFMEIVRLRVSDGSWQRLEEDWEAQCAQMGDAFCNYATSSLIPIKAAAETDVIDEWAIALTNGGRFMALASAIRATQKPYVGKVLRIREVTVCPLLDYGVLPEAEYVDTLIELLNGSVKLSETGLRAKHIKMHLRSPADAVFFRAVGNTLDSKGVFEATETHGAWLSFTKHTNVKAV